MSATEKSNVLVARVVHSPRSVQRVMTAIGSSGFAIDDLQYHRCGDRRAFVVAVLDHHLESRDLDHLSKVVGGTIDVLWAHPLPTLADTQSSHSSVRIEGYEVATSCLRGQTTTQARAAVVIDGQRHLGAGEGPNGPEALACAVGAAVHLADGGGNVTLRVAERWSNPASGVPAIVVAELRHSAQRGSAIGAGTNELEATASAIEALALPVLARPVHV